MRRTILSFFLILFVSLAAMSDDLVFTKGQSYTGCNASVAHAAKTRTIVYVSQQPNDDNSFSDIRMLVVKYNKKGKFRAQKLVVISGSQTSYGPYVSYNSETRKFLVTWDVAKKTGGNEIHGLLLTARGVQNGKSFTVLTDATTSVRGGITVPLLNKIHKGANKGDFLIAAYTNSIQRGIELTEFNSRNRKFYPVNNDSPKGIIPTDIIVTEAGRILIAGKDYYTNNVISVVSFRLGDLMARHTTVGVNKNCYVTNQSFTQLSPQLCIMYWSVGTNDGNENKYRFINGKGLTRGGIKTNKVEFNFGDANYLMASDGNVYNVSPNLYGSKLVLNTYNSKGKFKGHEVIVNSRNIDYLDLIILEIADLNQLLVFYRIYQNGNPEIRGHLHSLED